MQDDQTPVGYISPDGPVSVEHHVRKFPQSPGTAAMWRFTKVLISQTELRFEFATPEDAERFRHAVRSAQLAGTTVVLER